MSDYVYDLETYPNIFTFSAIKTDGSERQVFEMSTRKNEADKMFSFLDRLHDNGDRLVGFNNVGFDWLVVKGLLEVRDKAVTVPGKSVANKAYRLAQAIFNDQKQAFKPVKSTDMVEQIDLFKIYHFDNVARATSLKMLEFNMKADDIRDLPFPPGTLLTDDEMDVLISYNMHDVDNTLRFYLLSIPLITFREELTKKYKRSFMNHNDTKIGKDYFIMQLEKSMPNSCYKKNKDGSRSINQTKRPVIAIKDCLFSYYNFTRPEFLAIVNWFNQQHITETKGVFSDIEEHLLGDVAQYADTIVKRKKFKEEPDQAALIDFNTEHPMGWVEPKELKVKKKGEVQYSYWGHWKEATNLNVVVDGFRFDFGTGGIHGSVPPSIIEEDFDYVIVDADVASMYPNVAISNNVYPEHLTDAFCTIYKDVYEQRKSYAKNTAENAMLKLALNGVYGDSNNQYSPFYDPKYTMTITINGQLLLCLLAEKLLAIKGLKMVQINTDGVTVLLPRGSRPQYNKICEDWQKRVNLQLEFAEYSKMIIRDVNNYIAIYTNGKVKRKGAYQYEGLGWHQDQGGRVIAMAAEASILTGADLYDFISNHEDKYDFMLRTKVPRSSKLVQVFSDGTEVQQQNICRYYACKTGGQLIKVMPALYAGDPDRRLSVESGWAMKVCNNIKDFSYDIDYDYYVEAAKKLLIGCEETVVIPEDTYV